MTYHRPVAGVWGHGGPRAHLRERVRGRRRALRRFWRSYQGLLLLAMFVGLFVMGYVGYELYFDEAGETSASFWDMVYADLQLFTFTTRTASNPDTSINGWLQLARFLAPLVVGVGALLGLLRLFRDRFDLTWARLRRRHAIVAGAGSTGLAFVRALRASGTKVTVVEDDPANPNLTACRELGALVLTADARQPESLIQAGADRADQLVAVCGDDGRNAEIVLNAQRIHRRARGRLRCLAHIVDPDLWQLLRVNELRSDGGGRVRFDFFNIDEHGARTLVYLHPPRTEPADAAPHVLVVGDGTLAARVVTNVVRGFGHTSRPGDPLTVTVVGPNATAVCDQVRAQLPPVHADSRLEPVDLALDGLGLPGIRALDEIDIAYVCIDSDTAAVVMAQSLRNHLPAAPVIVTLRHSSGLTGLLQDPHLAGPAGLRQIVPFPLLDRTCHPTTLLSGAHESIARAIHARYRSELLAAGTPAGDPRVAPWDDLDPELQASNRAQAASIGEKLRMIGCDLLPQRTWRAGSFALTEAETMRLARAEHDRWRAERRAQGWTYGPERDDARKRNPLLVDWEELPDSAREQNVRIVAANRVDVEEAGYEIIRIRVGPTDTDWVEPVARAIHEQYLTKRAADGQPSAGGVPWEQLDEGLRRSNRAQAGDIERKLLSIGCRFAAIDAADADAFDGFTATELEELGRQEHERWVDERLAAGWRLGPRGPLTSPDLVSWEELPEPRRELDREAVRAIPTVLAAAGLAVSRVADRDDDYR